MEHVDKRYPNREEDMIRRSRKSAPRVGSNGGIGSIVGRFPEWVPSKSQT